MLSRHCPGEAEAFCRVGDAISASLLVAGQEGGVNRGPNRDGDDESVKERPSCVPAGKLLCRDSRAAGLGSGRKTPVRRYRNTTVPPLGCLHYCRGHPARLSAVVLGYSTGRCP